MGIKVIMITGDNQQTVKAIAGQVGIENVIAEVRLEGKADEIKKLQAEGKKIAMVGYGINNAPALAHNTLGIPVTALETSEPYHEILKTF